MNHLDKAAKLKEEKVLCNEPFKLHSAEDDYLTIPSMKLKETTVSLSHEDKIHKGISLCPKTPSPNQENIDNPYDAKTSSAFISSPLPSVDCCDSPAYGSLYAAEVDTSDTGSPKTPKGVFDPFAPGPKELELAPICKKVVEIPRKFTPRRLKFDDFDECLENRNQECDIETISEEMILESVYTAVLEAVVRMQTEAFLAKNPPSCTATAKTPPGGKLSGIADVCPAAPIKTAASKVMHVLCCSDKDSRNIDIVRRKLEF